MQSVGSLLVVCLAFVSGPAFSAREEVFIEVEEGTVLYEDVTL